MRGAQPPHMHVHVYEPYRHDWNGYEKGRKGEHGYVASNYIAYNMNISIGRN